MKRIILILLVVLAAIGGVLFWKHSQNTEQKPAEQKPAQEEEKSRVTHDENGRTVVKMDDETQRKLGLRVAKPAAAQISPELKTYGRVLDPTGLASLMIDLASAQAAFVASSNTWAREKMLMGQGNTSQSKLQTAEAAARRDQLAVQAAKDKLALTWGKGVAEQADLPAFIQPLTSENAVLVRVDLPVGETLPVAPKCARISSLAGKSAEAEFLGTTSSVDPQTLGRGAIFLMKPNALRLMLGEAVTGYLQVPGEPIAGVIVPSEAVVRSEGRAWVYIVNKGAETFTRTEIALDHPIEGGWLVSKGVSTNDDLVVTGAQVLLSEELKASLKSD